MIEPVKVAWDHAVQFYQDEEFLGDVIGGFLADGLVTGDPVVVLATRGHRDLFREHLAARGLDWDGAVRAGQLTWTDARAALEAVMVGRTPDADRFDEHIGRLIRRAGRSVNGGGRIRAYGELVDLLWREGQAEAALTLEDLWNDLGRAHSISLLCAYSRGNIYRESQSRLHDEICGRHARVLPGEEVPVSGS